jgi:hypothetical protein
MAYQLILSTDTLDQGRIKINDFFVNNSNLLSAGTGLYSVLTIGGSNTNGGDYSFVSGKRNTINSGAYTSILGGSGNTIGSGDFCSVVSGLKNSAVGTYGVVLGGFNNTAGSFSVILNGKNQYATNYSAILGGTANKVSGDYGSKNLAAGFSNQCYGSIAVGSVTYSSVLWGKSNFVGRSFGFIGGGRNNAVRGLYGSILGGTGNRVESNHTGSVVLGTGGLTRATHSFIFANGGTTTTPALTNNRFRIDSTGAATMNGALTQNGTADYAEYFEWEDQNPNNEDRTGFFVSLNKDKIKIDNTNVIGIVSATPSVIGDGAEEFWNKLHKRDIWGREIYQNYSGFTLLSNKKSENNQIYYVGPDNKIYLEHPTGSNTKGTIAENITINDINFKNLVHVLKINVFNENYDSNQEYIPRSERKEWTAIGLLGKLYVRTSEKITSQKIDVGSDGRAVNGSKYHVLKTTKEFDGDFGIIQILFK